MVFQIKINLPQKSVLGFKVLSSLHSSISCYLLLLLGRILNPFFGSSEIQIKAGSLFNIVLNISILILILNLFIKRKQLEKKLFIFLNSLLFVYLPISIYLTTFYIRVLFSWIKRLNKKYFQFYIKLSQIISNSPIS